MKRYMFWSALILCSAIVAPTLLADVKMREKTTFKLEGLLGGIVNRMAGGSDGITSTVSVRGSRMSRMAENNGQIIDLTEQKIYNIDVRRKEYTVMTFAEMRKQLEDARAQMAKQQAEMNPEDKAQAQEAAKQLDFDVDVKETGQTKTIAGQNAREVVLTIAMRERGRKLEESGGLVMTSTMWLAPRVAALDEVTDFNMKFYKAAFGGVFSGMDAQQMNAASVMLPGLGRLAERMAAERAKLQGTPLMTTTVFEGVKSAEQMKSAPASTGGGLGGMLARRMNRGASQQRTTALTTTTETLSIATTATDADVALPAGFKLKS